MNYKLFCAAPLLLLAACSRSAVQPAPAGYAAGSAAQPAATASSPAQPRPLGNPEPVARATEPAPPPNEAELPPAPGALDAAALGVTVPSGAVLQVRIDETVDTRRNRPGDAVHATLSQPVVHGGRTIIPAGTRFSGHVTTADASGRLKGRGHIGVALDSFRLNGRSYRVATTSVERASAAHKKRNGIIIGGATGLGAALGAIAGGGKGALIGAGAGAAAGTAGAAATGKLHVAIPAETPLRFTLRNAVSL
jgi:hypothetical protein